MSGEMIACRRWWKIRKNCLSGGRDRMEGCGRNREKRKECKGVVNVAKREARWRWERKLTEVFVRERSETKIRVQAIKVKNGQMIARDVKVSERFKVQLSGFQNHWICKDVLS